MVAGNVVNSYLLTGCIVQDTGNAYKVLKVCTSTEAAFRGLKSLGVLSTRIAMKYTIVQIKSQYSLPIKGIKFYVSNEEQRREIQD